MQCRKTDILKTYYVYSGVSHLALDILDHLTMTRLFLATIFLLCVKSNVETPTIEIKSVDMDIMTRRQVDCSEFNQAFSNNRKRTRKIEGQKAADFLSEMKSLKVFEEKTETDTRAVILIKYKDSESIICADRFSVCYNGTCYVLTDKLRRKIW
jgi:hypothetical protein